MVEPLDTATAQAVTERLLDWYGRNARVLPWRPRDGSLPDPYHVWLSEVMLQQTTVQAVQPYFAEFLRRWPTVDDLAAAELDDVLHAWQGLGYYARARNLHKCARVVSQDYGGTFPATESELRKLPGIGPYTAAAIAAIAFDEPAAVLDGNIERVAARLLDVRVPPGEVKEQLRAAVGAMTPEQRPGHFAQALMDLGATVCTPRDPGCLLCPVQPYCRGYEAGTASELPAKAPKPAKPTRRGIAFWGTRADGAVLIRRRPEHGLLGGMMEIPSTDWVEGPAWSLEDALPYAPFQADWRLVSGVVRHTFTHFHLELQLAVGRAKLGQKPQGVWCPVERLADYALPTAMKKVVRFAMKKAV